MTPVYMGRILNRRVLAWRNLVPAAFVLWMVFTFLTAFLFPLTWFAFAGGLGAYLAASFGFSISLAHHHRDARLLAAMPLVFALTHVSYGFGSLWGIVKPLREHSEWTKS